MLKAFSRFLFIRTHQKEIREVFALSKSIIKDSKENPVDIEDVVGVIRRAEKLGEAGGLVQTLEMLDVLV